MTRDLLLEIGTEEVPAAFIPRALSAMEELGKAELKAIQVDHGLVQSWGTPRRLALYVKQLGEKQGDKELDTFGPPRSVAFDEKGNPTKAALGFARAQGLDPQDLIIIETPKGEYVCAKKRVVGKATAELLPSILSGLISKIPFPKSMRWMDLEVSFVRPIHWILALFGEETIPFTFGNIQSGRKSFGHRFMSPDPFEIENPSGYISRCRKAFVIVDQKERREGIRRQIDTAAASVKGKIFEDETLLDQVTNLVEYHKALCGVFDKSFLDLPKEVLITSMREHQRYFTVIDDKGNLLPHFVSVINTDTKDPDVVRKGNERVLRARLSDAQFFFQEDQKRPLSEHLEVLKGVVFHSKLGTSYDKVMRFKKLALFLADALDPSVSEVTERAAMLCKADLTTEMVGEFPNLQGVMGREYARLSGETKELSQAIYEHYLPNFSGDRLPESSAGAFVSMADKMDTLVGCFGVGIIPTGAGDPFGLRRATLGIIHILLDKHYSLSLESFVEKAMEGLSDVMEGTPAEVKNDCLNFFRVRSQNLWKEEGYHSEAIEAVLSSSFDDLLEARERLKALHEFMGAEDFEDLAVAFKRVINIVGGFSGKEIDPSLFESPFEEGLYKAWLGVSEEVKDLFDKRLHLKAFQAMAALRGPIDQFFDNVMVNVEDPKLRENRLSLLKCLAILFLRIADFSKITTKK